MSAKEKTEEIAGRRAGDRASRAASQEAMRRRRSRSGPSPLASRRLSSAAEIALILALLSAPLMFGSVHLWSVGVSLTLALLAASTAALSALIARRKVIIHPLSAVLFFVVGFEAFQMIPLPPSLVGSLSPRAADVFELTLSSAGAWPAWRPLSLDPIATGVAVARHGSWLLLFLAATNLSRNRRRAHRLTVALGASVAIIIVLALGQKLLGLDRIFGVYPTRPGGWIFASFVNPNHFAAFLDLLAPVCLGLALSVRDRSRAALWGLVFVLAGAMCLLTLSRGGIVAMVVALTVFAILKRRMTLDSGRGAVEVPQGSEAEGGASPSAPVRPLSMRLQSAVAAFGPAFLVGGTVAVSLYLALDPVLDEVSTLVDQDRMADEVRWRIWLGSLPLVGDFFATGIGRGAFSVVYPMYKEFPGQVTFTHAENQLVQLLAELGAVVACAFLLAICAAWISVARRRDLSLTQVGLLAGIAGLMVHELTDFATSFGGVSVPATVALAVLVGGGGRGRRSRRGRIEISPLLMLAVTVALVSVGSYGTLRASGSLADEVLEDALSALEDGEPVEKVLLPAVKLRPSDHMLPLIGASVSLERGDAAGALRWVNSALYLSPSDSRGHLLAAEALARAGRGEQALLQYRLAAEWGAPTRRVLEMSAHRYPSVDQLLRVVPETSSARVELMRFLASRDRNEEALDVGLSALEEAPQDLDLLSAAARSASRLGRYEEAEALARRILDLTPREAAGYRHLASSHAGRGSHDEAMSVLQEGLTMLPGDPELSMRLARLLMRRANDPDGALEVLDAMRPSTSDRARSRMHALKGDAHRSRRRTRQAMEQYRTAARLSPGDPRPWISMGDHLMSMDQWERALDAFIEAGKRRETPAIEARIERAQERVDALRAFRKREMYLEDG